MTARDTRVGWQRAAAVIGVAAALLLTGGPAMAATPEPSPSCTPPTITVEPTTVSPGSTVLVQGYYFARCVTTDGTLGRAFLDVTVGLANGQDIDVVLGTAGTFGVGFFVSGVTIPALAGAGDTIMLGAKSVDPSNGLTYFASVPLAYSGGSATPTAVPAGTGGLGASDGDDPLALGIAGGIGLALITAGLVGLRRRRTGVNH